MTIVLWQRLIYSAQTMPRRIGLQMSKPTKYWGTRNENAYNSSFASKYPSSGFWGDKNG